MLSYKISAITLLSKFPATMGHVEMGYLGSNGRTTKDGKGYDKARGKTALKGSHCHYYRTLSPIFGQYGYVALIQNTATDFRVYAWVSENDSWTPNKNRGIALRSIEHETTSIVKVEEFWAYARGVNKGSIRYLNMASIFATIGLTAEKLIGITNNRIESIAQ